MIQEGGCNTLGSNFTLKLLISSINSRVNILESVTILKETVKDVTLNGYS